MDAADVCVRLQKALISGVTYGACLKLANCLAATPGNMMVDQNLIVWDWFNYVSGRTFNGVAVFNLGNSLGDDGFKLCENAKAGSKL
jgi:hypothetical protein